MKGLQNSTKRIKIFEYLKNKVTSDCFIFLQEIYSKKDSEKRWSDEFKGQFFFSHGKTNSCGVGNVQPLRNALFDKILTFSPPLVTQRNGLPYPLPSVT